MAILEVNNVKKIYTTRFGGNQVQALSNINFSVEKGEYVAIMGESGSGKTTLLNILAALDKPTSGEVLLNGKNLVSVKEKEISAFRRASHVSEKVCRIYGKNKSHALSGLEISASGSVRIYPEQIYTAW